MTVSHWFRNSGVIRASAVPRRQGLERCESASYGLYTSERRTAFYAGDGNEPRSRSQPSADSVWDGKWHQRRRDSDGSTVRLFIDGKELGSGMPATTRPIGTASRAGNTTLGAYAERTAT